MADTLETLSARLAAVNRRLDAVFEALRTELEGVPPEPAYLVAARVQARRRAIRLVRAGDS